LPPFTSPSAIVQNSNRIAGGTIGRVHADVIFDCATLPRDILQRIAADQVAATLNAIELNHLAARQRALNVAYRIVLNDDASRTRCVNAGGDALHLIGLHNQIVAKFEFHC
jgi:hypothetical protein